ncbi:MAG: hypothetical protein IJF00_05925 [Bacteroidaceae bacterium]|nr:hypothetical protein [Bacteroidaceae bacterium]MBQ3539614.1 hypothetical protein [Bacteroidaceae bacterium]MBQ6694094.1 hypothetical protein [Bacteroidaceae bacterium]
MKNFVYVAVLSLILTACGGNATSKERVATDCISDSVATTIVPPAATDVLPAAAPADCGKVATDVVPAK